MVPDLGKKVLVWGLGKTGFESALFLSKRGFHVWVWDQACHPDLEKRAALLRDAGIQVELGTERSSFLDRCDWVLISPGILPVSPVYRELTQRNVPLVSEIEAASWFCPTQKVIAVTGSAGKTTVSTLLSRIFERRFGRAVLCGNIGNPWIGELDGITASDWVVLEVSSFQLFHCRTFHPELGILLNISPNHLDWHKDLREYIEAKLNLFSAQTEKNFAIVRRSDRDEFFSQYPFKAPLSYLDDVKHPALKEAKNPNEAVLFLAASLYGIPAEIVREELNRFSGIEHRMETAGEKDGIRFINDSKSTTPMSLGWALNQFDDGTVLLIAGGRAKSKNFNTLSDLVKKKVKCAYLIGEAAGLIEDSWKGACPTARSKDLKESVEKAIALARPGDTVLLSPACASFDMFKSYGERGQIFKQTVAALTLNRQSSVVR